MTNHRMQPEVSELSVACIVAACIFIFIFAVIGFVMMILALAFETLAIVPRYVVYLRLSQPKPRFVFYPESEEGHDWFQCDP